VRDATRSRVRCLGDHGGIRGAGDDIGVACFRSTRRRAGDVALAANAVLNNFLLISAFFLDGLANAAEQLCGRAYGARARDEFSGAVRSWCLGLWLCARRDAMFALFGPSLIDVMTASPDVRRIARISAVRDCIPRARVFAFAFDGVYIGATWARDMRNLMVASLAIFLAAWFALRSFGNAGLGPRCWCIMRRAAGWSMAHPALLRSRSVIRHPRCEPCGANLSPGRASKDHGHGPSPFEPHTRSTQDDGLHGPQPSQLLHRPILGRNRRGIGADDLGQESRPVRSSVEERSS